MEIRNPKSEIRRKPEGRSPRGRPDARRRFGFRIFLRSVVSLFALAIPIHSRADEPAPAPFRIGFSSACFTEVNENDGKAAVKVWAQALARERGIPADPQPRILKGVGEIAGALTNKLVDAINLTTEEYWALHGQVALNQSIFSVRDNAIEEEYVLLVHRASGLQRLADLHGRSVGIHQGPRAALAQAWLETLLLQEGFGFTTNFFGRIVLVPKITKVVLPVFFRQMDACVVTRKGFETMIELNPQTGQQLKTLAVSPPVGPFLFCFRADYVSPIRTQIIGEIGNWHTTPAGRQILTIFQCEGLAERPIAAINSTLELLTTHAKLSAATNLVQSQRLCEATNAVPAGKLLDQAAAK